MHNVSTGRLHLRLWPGVMLLISSILLVPSSFSQIPQLISYQGRVVVNGANFSGGGQFRFALVNAAGNTTYWSNDGSSAGGSQPASAVPITVASGLYSVLLGDSALTNMTAIPPSVFNNSDVRLRVWFDDGTHGTQQLTPDQRIAAVGYAVIAGNVPDGAITGAKIAAGTITGSNIAAGTITGANIAGGAIGNTQLAAGSAAANLAAGSQSAVGSGGIIFSAAIDPALVSAGYVNIGTMTTTDGWQQRVTTAPPANGRFQVTGVWSGTEMIVWGGWQLGSPYFNDGSRYNPVSNSWTALPAAGAPSARRGHTAVWTGSEMIVWGGSNDTPALGDGARYNPVTNAWSVVNPSNAPSARGFHTAVWTGSEMIIWGGAGTGANLNDGARFNPSANGNAGLWTSLASATGPVPSVRASHTAVWTGTDMIIWGGADAAQLGDGARYTPSLNVWTTLQSAGAPSPRYSHTAVWTGNLMIVWGGTVNAGTPFGDGARYNPANDSWSPVSSGANVPSPRALQFAVWTGTGMIIWGGFNTFTGIPQNTGGRYDPIADTWNTMSAVNAPTARYSGAVVWSGTEMILWSGITSVTVYPSDGRRYNPVTDIWTQLASPSPVARTSHSAIWTGSEMIIWGGAAQTTNFNDGALFNPPLNTWRQTASTGAPTIRRDHSTVWTGTEMIIFGGFGGGSTYYNDIGRYNPATNAWNPAVPTGTPPATRQLHTAVWTGTEMLAWGGNAGGATLRGDGGRFNPTTNAWTSIGGVQPAARYSHSAVWTGTEMIIWGGNTGGTATPTGSRYAPSTDSWTATTATGAPPSARFFHSAVWTGTVMIIWGGSNSTYTFGMLGDGAAYTPGATPAWTALPSVNAPIARAGHATVWTGTEMIVWAGFANPSNVALANDGGRFNPTNNTWLPLNISAPPPARYVPSAVWTGSEMIIFGGSGQTFAMGDTWSYSPPKTLIMYQRP